MAFPLPSHNTENILIAISLLTLLFSPGLGFATVQILKDRQPNIRWSVVASALLSLLVVGGAMTLRLSFTNPVPNFFALSIAYISYCVLANFCILIPNKALRGIVLFFVGIPAVLGILCATIGVLGVMGIAGDSATAPDQVRQMAPHLVCEHTEWGGFGYDGFDVALYKTWDFLPFIRQGVSFKKVPLNEDTHKQPATTCDTVFDAYNKHQ